MLPFSIASRLIRKPFSCWASVSSDVKHTGRKKGQGRAMVTPVFTVERVRRSGFEVTSQLFRSSAAEREF